MKPITTFLLITIALATSAAASDVSAVVAPSFILHNGKIVTVNSSSDIKQAIAIKDDRILALGDDEAVLQLAGDGTRIIDLDGRAVIPGLIDGHVHLLNNAISFHLGVDIALVGSIEEMVERIRERVDTTPQGQIVFTTSGWLLSQLKEKRTPNRYDLDPVSPNNPVVVLGGHSLYLNSYALQKAGITKDTVSPEGGTIVKAPDTGEPTGQLVENAAYLATRLVSSAETETWNIFSTGSGTKQQKFDALREAQKKLNAVGVTSIREPGLTAADMRVYQELHHRGELTIRVSMGYSLDTYESADELVDNLETWGVSTAFGDSMLRIDGIGEFGIDGGFEAALMSEPYVNAPGSEDPEDYFGLQRIPTEKYQQVMEAMSRLGWRSTSHIVGDRGLDLALDAYAAADAIEPIAPKRWVIEHAHYTRPDQFQRIKDLGVVISTQFHPFMAAQNMEYFWGAERASKAMRMRDWLDAGLIVGGGSDWTLLPANPFWMLYFWVTRDTRLGGVTGPDQRITREEALQVMTRNNAYITFEEDIKGTLEPGKLADLVVLSDDFLTVPEAKIKDISPLLVMVGGKVVYDVKTTQH